MTRAFGLLLAGLSAALICITGGASALELKETPTLGRTHGHINLPPIARRVPAEPLIVDLESRGREIGRHGGDINMIIGKAKSIRYMVVYGYARLVGYTEDYQLKPDILKDVEVTDGRIFTLTLRRGHKWSDGRPFTTEDFRYYWDEIANNRELSPSGPSAFFFVDGELPKFEILSRTQVRYSWSKPNPVFLSNMAKARPPFIYRPAHYLKRFHIKYADPVVLEDKIKVAKVRNWAALHNRMDNMYKSDNPALPSLQPWVNTTRPPANRFLFMRNPFFHRIDKAGQQLPYIDRVVLTIADKKLIPAKVAAGEADLQARGLSFSDITVLKKGEKTHPYYVRLWAISKGAHIALYPNLTTRDPEWRKLVRDVRFRRALSLGIDRSLVNRVLYFGLGSEGNNTALSSSPLFDPELRTLWARFDPDEANRLLDEIGLTKRNPQGLRLLPDGRPLQIIVETAGESTELVDALELIDETWAEIGAKVFIKSSNRENLRTRAFAGQTVMSVWTGLDNGIPTPNMNPEELAPTSQAMLAWPEWGQYFETKGEVGSAPDLDFGRELLSLYQDWTRATTDDQRRKIWQTMLRIHAEQQVTIGILSEVRQPVIVNEKLKNVPVEAIYGWDPGGQFGIHRMDEFWWDTTETAEAAAGQSG